MAASPIYVVGHQNPDTDSICAAISYAHLLHAQGMTEAVAARQGPLRRETAYILKRFGVAEPILVTDVRPLVADAMTSPAVTVRQDDSLHLVGRTLQETGVRFLPVVNEHGELTGVVAVEDFAKVFFEGLDPGLVDHVPLDLDNVVDALDGKVLHSAPDRRLRDRVMVGAMTIESMLGRIEPDILLVMGDREDAQCAAIEAGVGAIVVTGDTPVSPEILQLARAHNVTVIAVRHHTYATMRLISMSIPILHIMRRDPPTCAADDFLEEVRPALRIDRSVIVVDSRRHVIGVLSRTDLINPLRRRVVLVDHNERGQSVAGLDQAEVLGVIDHHRIADFQTASPPFMRLEPVGSCNTVIAKLYRENGVAVPPSIAAIMLSGILADTLVFRSPTTTLQDRDIAAELAELADVDPLALGGEIIAQASDLSNRTAAQILSADFKEFSTNGTRFGISVVETADAASVLSRRAELLAELRSIQTTSYASVLLAIMDIAHECTDILIAGSPEAVASAFGAPLQDGARIHLDGILSRKKQIVPLLGQIKNAIEANQS